MRHLLELLRRFPSQRVVVVGDALLDSYLDGRAERLAREGPVPVVRVASRRDYAGGAANVAVNLAALGAHVELVAVVGDDDAGRLLARLLTEHGVSTGGLVVDPERSTVWLQRARAGDHLIARLDQGTVTPLGPATERRVADAIRCRAPEADLVVVSDYEKGLLTDGVVAALGAQRPPRAPEAPGRPGQVLVVDAKRPAAYRPLRPTAVKPNWSEALGVLGPLAAEERALASGDRAGAIARRADRILDATNAEIAAVTLDRDGALVCERGRPPYRTFTTPVDDGQAAGAGDTFLAGLALCLAAGGEVPEAAELASAAAEVVVARAGTAACTAEEVEAQVLGGPKVVRNGSRLAPLVAQLREEGKSVVFTNGCFDLLHRGHITYLNRAKTLGDVLVVGVNSDESVRWLKGPDRPINPLEDRIQVLVALSCVDYVVPFDGPTPERLLTAVRPDRYVKGGDYTHETLPEEPLLRRLGVQIEFLPLVEDRSTSRLIDRIRRPAAG